MCGAGEAEGGLEGEGTWASRAGVGQEACGDEAEQDRGRLGEMNSSTGRVDQRQVGGLVVPASVPLGRREGARKAQSCRRADQVDAATAKQAVAVPRRSCWTWLGPPPPAFACDI